MIFSDRLLFLHVPKTGGSSVVHYLLDALPKPAFYSRPADMKATVPPGVTVFEGVAHEDLAEARVILERRGLGLDPFPVIVACVRNPYALEVSRFAFLRRDLNSYNHGTQQALALLDDFELFAICSRPHGQRPLESYFTLDGVVPPNLRIVRLESLDKDLPACLAAGGIDGSTTRIPHSNATQHEHFRQYYNATSEQAVYEKYKWVFNAGLYPRLRFGVEPEQSSNAEPDLVDQLLAYEPRELAGPDAAFAAANMWLAVAEIHRHWLRPDAQRDALEHALDQASTVGSNRLIGRTVRELACCMALSGSTTIRAGIARCRALLETPGTTRGLGETKLVLAELLGGAGRLEEAHAICEQAEAQSAELALAAASVRGSLELLAGADQAAELLFRRGRPWHGLELVGDHSEALYRVGRHREAASLAGFTELTAPAADVRAQARWRRIRAKLLAAAGEFAAAADLAREAVQRIARCTSPNLHADALVDLAAVLRDGGREEEATSALEDAVRLYALKENVVSAHSAASLLRDVRSNHAI